MLSVMDFPTDILASNIDDSTDKIWFWLIVGVFYVIKKIIEFLNQENSDDNALPETDTGSPREKQIKKAMGEMRRSVAPQQTTPPASPPNPIEDLLPKNRHTKQPQSKSQQAPTNLPKATKRQPTTHTATSVPHQPRSQRPPIESWTEKPIASSNSLSSEYDVKVMEEAQQSIQSLSDAEQLALQRLYSREMNEKKPKQHTPEVYAHSLSLKSSLQHSQALKAAILYQEILGKPKALR